MGTAGREDAGTTARSQPRPRPGPVPGSVRVAVGAAWALLLVAVAAMLVRLPSLPDRVPVHYDATGRPDDWGPPAALWALVGLWVVLQAGVTLLVRVPHVHNFPVTVTDENASRLYRVSQQMLARVMIGMSVVLLGLVPVTADGAGTPWLVVLGLVGILAAMVVGIAQLLREH